MAYDLLMGKQWLFVVFAYLSTHSLATQIRKCGICVCILSLCRWSCICYVVTTAFVHYRLNDALDAVFGPVHSVLRIWSFLTRMHTSLPKNCRQFHWIDANECMLIVFNFIPNNTFRSLVIHFDRNALPKI